MYFPNIGMGQLKQKHWTMSFSVAEIWTCGNETRSLTVDDWWQCLKLMLWRRVVTYLPNYTVSHSYIRPWEIADVAALVPCGHSTLLQSRMTALPFHKEFSCSSQLLMLTYLAFTARQTDTHRRLSRRMTRQVMSVSNWKLLFPVVTFTLCSVIDVRHVVTWHFVLGWSWFSSIRVLGFVVPCTNIRNDKSVKSNIHKNNGHL